MLDRFALFNAMVNRKIVVVGGKRGIIQSIQMEDGSGYSFNVAMSLVDGTKGEIAYVRFRGQ